MVPPTSDHLPYIEVFPAMRALTQKPGTAKDPHAFGESAIFDQVHEFC
jgi:hypothetical protein